MSVTPSILMQSAPWDITVIHINLRVCPLGATICPAPHTAPDFLVWCNAETSEAWQKNNKRGRKSERMDKCVTVCVCVCTCTVWKVRQGQTHRTKWKASSELTSHPTRGLFWWWNKKSGEMLRSKVRIFRLMTAPYLYHLYYPVWKYTISVRPDI